MGFCQNTDLDLYRNVKKKERKIMSFVQTTDLDSYEKRRIKIGFCQNTDLPKKQKLSAPLVNCLRDSQ